ncbi:MAG TPA: alpha/beta fold hydrolase, partial [Bacteroidetes bacterium]|nr:alpha/beta fold hydrolase [Bacteroidota bacterium]
HAETFGNPADPLLIQLHGGPGADYATHLQAKAFAQEGYFVIFFDQRGAGLSRRHGPDSFTLENYFEDLRQIIAHYRYSPDQKVFLMGHSWGAMYATGYANRYPDAVNGLVLSEPGGFTLAEMQAYLGRAFAVKPFTEGINDIVWAEQLIAGKSHAELDYEFMLLAVTGSNVGDDGPLPISRVGAVCSQSMLALADRDGLDLASQLSAFQTKVLFMYSDQNMAYGYDHALRVSSAFPNVDLLEITGTGHDLHFFAFDAYFAASLTYLNALR